MERRRSPRIPIQVWVEQFTEAEMYLIQASNLSIGGLFLSQAMPYPKGTLVNLRLELTKGETPLEVQGRIAYPVQGNDSMGMGVEFVELSNESKQIISEFLEQLHSDGIP